MTKAKKRIMMAASYVAVAALAIGGTFAYLTSDPAPVSNVFTSGDVEIVQHEYQRPDGVAYNAGESGKGNGIEFGTLEKFEQGKVLMPAVPVKDAVNPYTAEASDLFFWGDYVSSGTAGNGLWNDNKISNVMDKFVFVENTGNAPAYYRTIIAFECPEGMEYSEGSDKEFMMNTNGSSSFIWENNGYAVIDDVRYLVMTATYNKELGAGVKSIPSLLQVLMTEHVTSEDMELIGDTYEILVKSQAVQADSNLTANEMLDDAFGEVNAANAAIWFADSVTVAAPAAGAVRPAGYIPAADGETIDNLVVVDESDDTTNLRALYTKDGNINGDLTVTNSYLDGTYAMNVTANDAANAVLTVSDTALKGWVSYAGFASASFTNCTFDQNSNPEIYKTVRPYCDTVFTNCDFAAGYEFWLDKLNGDKITLVNCTIGGVEITSADQLNIVYGDASSVEIG